MDLGIRELKHRYRVNTALNQVLPLADRGFSIPLSTGNPLFDAALTEKLQTSASLTEVEHLQRSWELCRRATDEELRVFSAPSGPRRPMDLHCWYPPAEDGGRS